MQPIKDLLNRIRWDSSLKPEEFDILYLDRISKKLINLKFPDIEKIDEGFLVIKKDEETYIPLHRIREVRQAGKTVWKRG